MYNQTLFLVIPTLLASVFISPTKIDTVVQKKNQSFNISISKSKLKINKKIDVNFALLKDSGIRNVGHGYFGFTGKVPGKKSVDFNKALEKQWRIKTSIKNSKPSVSKSYKKILSRYKKQNREVKTLSKLLVDVNHDISTIKPTIQFDKICIDLKIKDNRCSGLSRVSNNITSNMLLSYGLTEVFPYRDGKSSVATADLLLRTAGENFINSIPAKGDGYLSFGLYQFTSFAVRSDASGDEGANKIAKHSQYKIPGSVLYLTSKDQHRAALYFSIYNLSNLVRKLNDKQYDKFMKYCVNDEIGITQFIATAHHLPAVAIKNAQKWIDGNCFTTLESKSGPKLTIYAAKTRANFNALKFK